MINNQTFLATIFGDDACWAHVTSFMDDPANIPNENRFRCWSGNYNSKISIQPNSNQYFTISTFYADKKGKARRRKALFRCTHVIVADDVKEKLPEYNVNKLPPPTYKLETSPGSEQWGWVLDHPCQDRAKVENLLDGLVEQGLAPAGKDPGMKGVTRYVRLPEGVNTKAKRVKANGGTPPRCKLLEWHPERRVSIEELAEPFEVDLDAERRDSRVDGAANLPDHPLLQLTDIIHVKSVRSDGRFDITCPWVDEHTDAADDGAAIFTNQDGSIGFKCHHGACEQRTGKDLLDLIEITYPEFKGELNAYCTIKEFDIALPTKKDEYNFLNGPATPQITAPPSPPLSDKQINSLDKLWNTLQTTKNDSSAASISAITLLKSVDTLSYATKIQWHNKIRKHMGWTKSDLKKILNENRDLWYTENVDKEKQLEKIYKENVFIMEVGQFYNNRTDNFLTPEVFHNSYCDVDEDIKTEALMKSKCKKVEKLTYYPGKSSMFVDQGISYVNTWMDDIDQGAKGDPTPWLDLFDVLEIDPEEKNHILNFFACTLQKPELKINHAIILGGMQGIGKDLMLYPLIQAMGRNAKVIQGAMLKSQFNDYLMNTKLLQINEIDAGNYADARAISNKIKGFIAAPPNTIPINRKNINGFNIRNVVNVVMGTNEMRPLVMTFDSRRYYMVWSDLNIRGADNQMLPQYTKYYHQMWEWMREGKGWKYCVNSLINRDISNFIPGMAPNVTQAMIDVINSSKDPVSLLFSKCVESEVSLLASDLVTMNDIYKVMRSIDPAVYGVTLATNKLPSENVLGRILSQSHLVKQYRCTYKGKSRRLYSIRNHNKYDGNHISKKILYENYLRNMEKIKDECQLTVIEGGGTTEKEVAK